MADNRDGDDDVGYGRPPRKHQFKPGQSGNPKGRPKHKMAPTKLGDLFNRPVKVNGKPVPYTEAFVLQLMNSAFNGNPGAIRHVSRLMFDSGVLDASAEQRFERSLADAEVSLTAKLRDLAERQRREQEAERLAATPDFCNGDGI